jgi:hypothetical protein
MCQEARPYIGWFWSPRQRRGAVSRRRSQEAAASHFRTIDVVSRWGDDADPLRYIAAC